MLSINQAKRLRVGDHVINHGRVYTVIAKPITSFWHKRKVNVSIKYGKRIAQITEANLVEYNQIIILK